jgi:hypothetical protein
VLASFEVLEFEANFVIITINFTSHITVCISQLIVTHASLYLRHKIVIACTNSYVGAFGSVVG